MKHLLVDALSVNNLSGRHVLVGHVNQIAAALGSNCKITVLLGSAQAALAADFLPPVEIHRAAVGASWFSRNRWLLSNGRRLRRELDVDLVFSPSGMLSTGFGCPQIVLAQNPWPLVPGMARGTGMLKSLLQRRAFARAQHRAALMVFNSSYMLELYAKSFGKRSLPTVVALQGIGEELFVLAARLPLARAPRRPLLLSVSVMARHKAVEVLVSAFSRLCPRHPEAELILVGSWPDLDYRREIEGQVESLGLGSRVLLEGHVDTQRLHQLYSEARAFCLLSRCESFGIPAVEAQAFGTPVIVADGTAAPEIIGQGGLVVAPDSPSATVDALDRLLLDEVAWAAFSKAALANAERFHWQQCSAPLISGLRAVGLGT